LRIVLDTNVVLSALLWRGAPYLLLRTIRQREDIGLFSSTVLLEELADVLIRQGPAKRLSLIGQSAHQVLAHYVEAVDLVTPVAVPRTVPGDPDDDHVIAAAVAADADMIASGDRHLLSLGTHEDIRSWGLPRRWRSSPPSERRAPLPPVPQHGSGRKAPREGGHRHARAGMRAAAA
jgi:putative PIN family toxin of toxin-antitoxin system